MKRAAVVEFVLCLFLPACAGGAAAPPAAPSTVPDVGRADVGGYELAYACEGEGSPVVVMEAGLGAAGTQEFFSFMDRVSSFARICAYDRAGTGSSDLRPGGAVVTAGLMADELHALLPAIGVELPVVVAAHSYGGMPARVFADVYPDEVAGLVLVDVSSEPEVPVYRRLGAGPWIDDTDRIDMRATLDELRAARDLGDLPLVVVTAEMIDDRWLATVPELAARAQARLAGLSSDGIEVVALGSRHFVHDDAPGIVATAIRIVVASAADDARLPPCDEAFAGTDAECVPRGSVPELVPA